MAANYLFGDEGSAAGADGAAEDLRLLRRYEPVLRFTRGELFLPMAVPMRFALAILAAAAIGVVAWVAVLAAVGNWRVVIAGLLALAALVLLVANIRDFFAKR